MEYMFIARNKKKEICATYLVVDNDPKKIAKLFVQFKDLLSNIHCTASIYKIKKGVNFPFETEKQIINSLIRKRKIIKIK